MAGKPAGDPHQAHGPLHGFSFTPEQQHIRGAILKHCTQFPDSYWLERDRDAIFPHEFFGSMAEGGWLGIAMPTQYAGSGLGITEAAIMMQAVAEADGGMAAASGIHGPVFGLQPIAQFGTEAQKQPLGGMGYAQEYHIERYLRECLIPRTAPVSPHMILNFLAEKVLELPCSY